MVRQNKTKRGSCRGNYARCAGVALLFLAALACEPCVAATTMTIRTKADMRLWQTVHDRAAPLAWQWEEAADSATLTFSNRVTRAVWAVPVSRESGATRGSCVQPAPAVGETVVDVTLVQKAGANEVARETATLAYVAGAGGGPITVQANPGTRTWTRVREPRVYAVDPAWQGLEGESGYDIVWPDHRGLMLILK